MENIALLIPILGISCGLLAIFGGVVIRPWFQYRHRKLELEAQMVAEKAAQYAAGSERLEQRVRVLERIITDKGVSLADEIEALRHERDEPKPLN
jgi:alpha-D-ribose 1-methylphosphonate 5-triphosphate synthase subunit PhnI